MSVGPRKFCSLVLAWCLERVPQDKIEQWWFNMEKPLPGEEDRPSEEDLQQDADTFMAAMNSLKRG